VRALCTRAAVPLIDARWDTRRRMRARGLSGQEGLRVLRREFLRAAARRAGARFIATGHTADDQLETLLMRLARGTGLRGLGGMHERRRGWRKPMLEVTRADIEADLARAGIPWREDRSNADSRYLRTRIRKDVIPALVRAAAPEGDATLVRSRLARRAAELTREAREARRALRRWTSFVLPAFSRIQPAEIALDSAQVAPYPIAARRLILATLWQRLPGALPGLTRRHLESLDRLAVRGRHGQTVMLPGGWFACRERESVRFRRPSFHQHMETR
jgi:tRNA(Ile)-lysidine synthase